MNIHKTIHIALCSEVYTSGEWIATDRLVRIIKITFPNIHFHLIGLSDSMHADASVYETISFVHKRRWTGPFSYIKENYFISSAVHRSLIALNNANHLDCIIATQSFMFLGAFWISKRAGIPLLYYFHGTRSSVLLSWWQFTYREILTRLSESFSSVTARRVIVPCEFGKQYIVRKFLCSKIYKNIDIVPNAGIDYSKRIFPVYGHVLLDKYLFVKGKKVILFRGSIQPVKGLLPLIHAFFQFMNTSSEQYILVLLYPSETIDVKYKDTLNEAVKKLGIKKGVYLIPDVPIQEQVLFMNYAWVCILPSFFELQPLVLLESLVTGAPMLATGVGDVKRILSLIDSDMILRSNKPSDIVYGLKRYESKEIQLRKNWTVKGRRYVKTFHSNAIVLDTMKQILQSL